MRRGSKGTILVTGGAGFIGVYVLEELVARGKDALSFSLLEGLSRRTPMKDRVTIVKGDVSDLGALLRLVKGHQVTHMIHLASLTTYECQGDPPEAVRTNCIGMGNILEAARVADVERVVFSSSIAVYGDIPVKPGERVEEEHLVNPTTIYSASKLFAENLGLNYAKLYGLDFLALRLAGVYGFSNIAGKRGRPQTLSEQARAIVEYALIGLPVDVPKGGSQGVDWIYVEDVAGVMAKACLVHRSRLKHTIFNIGSGELHALQDFALAVKKHKPEADIRIGSEMDAHYPFAGPVDIERAKRELGLSPRPFSMGVEDYIRSATSALKKGSSRL